MELARIVGVARDLRATRSRSAKITLLADALLALPPSERDAGVAFLTGEPRQSRLDLGPKAVFGIEVPPAMSSTLSVGAVDAQLQRIADVPAGPGSRSRRIELLAGLLAVSTDEEQRWLRALILRELRQGALEGLLIPAIARAAEVDEPAVRRAAMVSGDLRATADAALSGGRPGLASLRLRVGVPLQPMLASPASDVASAVDDLGEVVVDAKLDGARIQVHRDGEQVRVFTRNLLDVTTRVPEVVDAALALPVTSIVLDGEALALAADGRPRPFQETMQRFGRERDVATARRERPLHARFFDVLHLEGVDLIDLPLRDRLAALVSAVPPELRVEQLVTADEAAIRAFVTETLAAGHEGVMIKSLDAPYEAGRRGAGWRKLKPVHTLDLVVLAAEWGSGRRRGWLSNLHLGARRDDGDGLVMLGKTFKGLTDATLAWQTEQLLARETHREGHVVFVQPELVVEIAFDGVVRSTRYPGGVALRFARVKGYRPDKPASQADTLATVRSIRAGTRPPELT